jgi:hypothetical protein
VTPAFPKGENVMRTQIASKIRFAAFAVLAIIMAQPALNAQTAQTIAVANIPFDFQVDSYHYTAGKYTLQFSGNHVLILQSNAGSGVMEVWWDSTTKPSTMSRLVFHHYGSQYYLRELRVKGSQEFLNSSKSKDEKSAQKREVASNSPTSGGDSTTEVALVTASR